jgi:DNA-directed RNA polymerase specialized sigma24 family protein
VKNLNYTGRKDRVEKKTDIKIKNAGSESQEHRALVSNAILNAISNVFSVSPDEVPDSPDARKAFVNALNDLRGREVMAIMLRAIGMSYRAAGKVTGVSGNRVRYNEARGLRKLRHPDKVLFIQRYLRNETQ